MTENKAGTTRKDTWERELAPHVEDEWTEEFTAELRVRGVSGENIGAALAELDSHCAASGETAAAAFGAPADYARSLDVAADHRQLPRGVMAAVVPTVIQLLGMLTMIHAAFPFARGDAMAVTAGALAGFALLASVIAVMFSKPQAVMRLLVDRVWMVVVLAGAVFAGIVVLMLLLRYELFEVSSTAGLGTGVLVMLLGTVWEGWRVRRGQVAEDIITVPFEEEKRTARHRRWMRRMEYGRVLLVPVFAVVNVVIVIAAG